MFEGVGEYGIPKLHPEVYESGCEWIGFNYAKTAKDREKKGVHCFVDDYIFQRLWTNIDRYIPMLSQFRYVMSPDFNLHRFPKGHADIQPLPQALGRRIPARGRDSGYPNNLMEYTRFL